MARSAGSKLLRAYQELGVDPASRLGTRDPVEVWRMVKRSLVRYMASGPVVLMVLKGNSAVEVVRKLVGPTAPRSAPPGTIRGDFSIDSPAWRLRRVGLCTNWCMPPTAGRRLRGRSGFGLGRGRF